MSFFTMLPVQSGDASLPVINESDIRRFSRYEEDAYGHWIFDRGPASLQSMKGNKLLVPQSVAPVYAANHVSVAAAPGNALLSDLEEPGEAGGAKRTIALVVAVENVASLRMLAGTMGTSSNNWGGGPYFGSDGASVSAGFRGGFGNFNALDEEGANVTAESGLYYFVAQSYDFSGETNVAIAHCGGYAPTRKESPSAYNAPPPGTKMALGNAYYSTSVSATRQYTAEFVLYDRFLDEVELVALYERSKARMAARGIVVV